MPRYASTTASVQASPSARAARRAGAPSSKVIAKSVTYSRATLSRSAASAMASRSVTVGDAATSWARAAPSPLGAARRIASYTEAASATVVSASTRRTRSRSGLPSSRRAARHSGPSSSMMPRLVLRGVSRWVAATAARTAPPRGVSPAAAMAGPIATALTRKSSYRVSWKWRPGETLPGFGALTSSRHASWAAAPTSAGVTPVAPTALLLLLADEPEEPAGREVLEVVAHLLERRACRPLLERRHGGEAQLRLAVLGRRAAVEVGLELRQVRPHEPDLGLAAAHERQVRRRVVALERGWVLGLI